MRSRHGAGRRLPTWLESTLPKMLSHLKSRNGYGMADAHDMVSGGMDGTCQPPCLMHQWMVLATDMCGVYVESQWQGC